MLYVVLLILAVFLFAYAAQGCKRNAVVAVNSPYVKDGSTIYKIFAPIFFAAVAALLVLFSGFRTSYNDTFFYIHAFELIDTTISQFLHSDIDWMDNPFFTILQILIKQYISDDSAYLVFIATIVPMVSLLLFFYKKSEQFGDCVFLFLAMGLMFFSMGAMKQFIAIGIGVWSIHFASKKKWIRFILVILIAMMFHKYAFFYLAVIFFLKDDIWSWKSVFMLVMVVAIGFSFGTFAKGFLESTEDISGGYDMTYMEEGVSILRVLVYAVPSVLSFMCRKYINDNASQFIKICINLGIVTFLMITLAFFGGAIIFTRFAYYLEPFMYIGFIWTLENCFEGKVKTIVRLGYFPAFLFYFVYNNFIHMTFNFRSLIAQFNTI